ncbi:MAG: 3-hydroxyanthranilate 3,4-dioxygenase [Pseudomonadota bacterium]
MPETNARHAVAPAEFRKPLDVHAVLKAVDFPAWLKENEARLRPPVCIQQIWRDTDFIVSVVGGPNRRHDYHDDPLEELFYQFRGNAYLSIMTPEGPRRVDLAEGAIFLLPPHVRHSPQRPEAGSLCLLVERTRPKELLDGFEWYCPSCHALLHRVEVHVSDLATQLPQAFDAFHADLARRTCQRCGTLHPGK